MKTGYLWIAAWLVFYALGFRTDMQKLFANRGLHIIGKEYYRLFTGLLLHVNLFHLAVNAAGMYFVTGFLNGQTEGWKLTVFTVLTGTLANLLFSAFYPRAPASAAPPSCSPCLGFSSRSSFCGRSFRDFRRGRCMPPGFSGLPCLETFPSFLKTFRR